jgi:flagellar M-ring protein FliF
VEWFEQLRLIWTRLPAPQRVFMISVVAGLIMLVVLLGGWATREQYSVLYGDLDPSAASEIVQELDTSKIKYKLSDGGRTLLVPKNVLYDARMRLASSGLPQAAGQGYEILDTNKMGWTDFVQKLQYRRALEGEIARTIQSMDEIAQARVHLVIPEPSLFEEDKKPATASVVLKLRNGTSLREGHVQSIVHLVAASVEGLDPGQVTVIDTRGRLLSRPVDGESLLGSTADQMQLAHSIEEGLVQKAQTALECVLGPNKAVVRVSVELDLERAETTRELYDAENPVVRSEQRSESTSAETGNSEQSTTNYEISKTVQHVVGAAGTVKRLSASVFVDGTYTTNQGGERQYVPRTPEEMQKLTGLIQTAVGYDAQRGDQLTVENIAFDDTEMQRTIEEMEKTHLLEMVQRLGGLAATVLLAGGLLFILWRLVFRKPTPIEITGAVTEDEEEEVADELAQKARDKRELRLMKKVEEISKQHEPDDIARIIRAWMREV